MVNDFDTELAALALTAVLVILVLMVSGVISLVAGFLIAKLVAFLGWASYSTTLWLGVSAIVFVLMMVLGD